MAYIIKNTNKFEIKSTLEKVMKGQIVFSGMLEPDYEKKFSTVLSGQKYRLTSNQKDIVIFLSQGLTQVQIADKKKTSVSTVEKTLKHIREKCDAKNNAELVKILLERGVI
jgi:DNA-binding NarL/FixJ family response regulator